MIISDKKVVTFPEISVLRVVAFPILFPKVFDAITARGLKHLKDLIKAIKQGYKSYIIYVIQREDCSKFTIAKDIDPEYYKLLTLAKKKNVKILCYDCKFSSKGIKLNNRIKLQMND